MEEKLHKAVVNGNIEVTKELLKNGANINHLHGLQGTPLCAAISSKQQAIVNLLLQYDACDVNAKDYDGEPPLCLAIRKGFCDVIQAISKHKLCDLDKMDPITRRPPISIAVIEGDKETVERLLEAGCSVNKADSRGNLPIHYAITDGRADIVDILLKYGADLSKCNAAGHNAVHHCIHLGNFNLLKILQEAHTRKSPRDGIVPLFDQCVKFSHNSCVHLAVETEDIDLLKYVIQQQNDLNVTNVHGHTPLFMAVTNNVPDSIVTCLLENGANPDIESEEVFHRHYERQKRKLSSLHAAINVGNLNVVKLLVKYGANVNVTDYRGEAPLSFALHRNHGDIAKYLLNETDVDTSQKNFNEEDALFAALSSSEAAYFVKELVRKGCDVNARNKDDATVLHSAVDFDCTEVAEVLLENGANPNEPMELLSQYDSTSTLPLHMAATEGNIDMCRLLLLYGADVNKVTEDEESALICAMNNDVSDATIFLLKCGAKTDQIIYGDLTVESVVNSIGVDIFEGEETLTCDIIKDLLRNSKSPKALQLLSCRTINDYFLTMNLSISKMRLLPLPKKLIDMLFMKNI